MNKEIDIRALMNERLTSDYFVESCSSFNNDIFGEKVVLRSFNNQVTWSTIKQTNFIESIYMECELPLIIVFEISSNPVRFLLVDGLNRFMTIKRFLNDELKLCKNGIEKAAFLEKNTFSNLDKEAREYFLNRGIQILKYSYTNSDKKLSIEEINAIAKQLYIRYNSGIKLKNEEIQKADYQDDWVTQQIEIKLKDQFFLEKLQNIYLAPQRKCNTFYEKTLMYARLVITSSYAPLQAFCKQQSYAKRIDMFYKDCTSELNKENILNDFIFNVDFLNQVKSRGFLDEYKELQNQEFFSVTYWILFKLRKNNLINLNDFDWENYITYFGEREKQTPLFSFYRINLITRYEAVIEYIKNQYGIDLYKYSNAEIVENKKNKIYSFNDLPKYNFQLARDGITIDSLIDSLKKNAYILKPTYQRREINDKLASSFIIESILLNINIPDILIYRRKVDNNRSIFEVVDGQQRCWTLLSFLNQKYKNFYGEEVASIKEGFALKGLTILPELNDKKVNSLKNRLPQEKLDKIKNDKIRVVYIPEEDNPYFSPKDYFTRINKTIKPLKKSSFRYWNVRYDEKLMDIASKIAQKYYEILPIFDSKYLPQQYIVEFAYLFFNNIVDVKGFGVQQVTKWLNDFEINKNNLIIKNREVDAEPFRIEYIKAFNKVDLFLGKILNWLNSIDKTINELISVKFNKSFSNLSYLYYLLKDINEADLINNNYEIYNIIHAFYVDVLMKKLKLKEINDILKSCKDLLSPFFIRTVKQKKLNDLLEII